MNRTPRLVEHADADLRQRLGIATIDEPDSREWDAIAATFDALDVGLASRGDVRELLLRAYQAGGEAARETIRNGQDTDAWEHLLSALHDADLSRTQRQDIEDHAAAHAARRVSDELVDAEHRNAIVQDARAAVSAAREALRTIRQFHDTAVLSHARLDGEIGAVDARLAEAETALTEAWPA